MRLALAHARAETLQFARYPAYSIPTVLFPAALLLLFGRQFERGEPERLLAGFAATALLTVVFFQFGVGIATSRTTPWETYLRTLPVSAATRVSARLLAALAFGTATVSVVVLVSTTVYGAAMPAWRWGALGVTSLLGSIPFAFLGVGLGYWLPPRAALPVTNLLFLPLAVGGSLWTRPRSEELPRAVDIASQCLPTRNWVEVLDAVATGDRAVPLHHVGALFGWSAAFFGFAWLGYRRDEGERFT